MPSPLTYKTTSFSTQNRLENTPVFHSDSSGKEKDSETGYYYFGARYNNSDLSLWLSVDPMADKYPNLSPYNYCAWNPVKLVDPNGRDIDPSCIKEWNRQKKEIIKKRDELLVYSIAYKNAGFKGFSRQASDHDELNNIIGVMGEMEASTQRYKLIPLKNTYASGCVYLDEKKNNVINVEYTNTALLVHELAHCGQFERREIGLSTKSRGGFTDYWDELSAYRAQAAYDANTLPINQKPILTVDWLKDIKDSEGNFPYRGIGRVRYSGDSDCFRMMQAYPKTEFNWSGTLSSQKGTYFKP